MLPLFSRIAYACLATGLAAVPPQSLQAHGETSMQTRAPTKTNELDRDENGVIDSYREEFSLGEGLTLSTTERLKETTREVHFRFTHIMLDGRPLWQETWRRADQSRSNQIYRNCPFDIGFDISESTGKERLSLIDDESRFVALLVRKEDGRLAPVTDEELERLQKVAQDVSDFGMELLERADELMDDEEAANEVKRKLDQAVEEYNQGASDRPNVQSSQRTRSRNPSGSMKPFTALTSRDVAASSMPAIGINLAHGELDIYV